MQFVRTMWAPGAQTRQMAWCESLGFLNGGAMQWLVNAAGWQSDPAMKQPNEHFAEGLMVLGLVLTTVTAATGMLPGPRRRRLLLRRGVRASADVVGARWVGRSHFGNLLMELTVRVRPAEATFDSRLVVVVRRWPPRKPRPVLVRYDRSDPRRITLAH